MSAPLRQSLAEVSSLLSQRKTILNQDLEEYRREKRFRPYTVPHFMHHIAFSTISCLFSVVPPEETSIQILMELTHRTSEDQPSFGCSERASATASSCGSLCFIWLEGFHDCYSSKAASEYLV